MINVSGLNKSYGKKKALDNLTLSIPSNSIYGLLGPNGAGKTTLISILNGLVSYDSGEVTFFDLPLKKNLSVIRQRCSLIPQSLAFYENLSVKENLQFFAGVQKIKGQALKDNLSYAVETNRLSSMMDQKSATLSGGQKRRLNIAIGLLNNPDILFFDEPTVGIDPESRNDILDTIKAYKSDNKTVIYTSHYMPEIEKICDEVAIVNAGKIVKQGSISSMVNNEESQQVIVELYPHSSTYLSAMSRAEVTIVDQTTLLLTQSSSELIAQVLHQLELQGIKIKQIRYGATTLESLFINLTSKGRTDV
ncbi:ABC transporter ATP-binding protein [Aliivibrio sp. S4TY2]|uniref:ABC transporter ATP-binding protein n=1 Tax=unclassified Aliivibrio TaxID=2645654 RepID=UPI0023797AB4|nr:MULTISPECIES: ABC transporter ATP-binding protein [unclassified Aliivibrio]MDD9154640.1 ABC transporter ATP-binding protein [Aliivibrio sp. S4TY2]MDD9158997.1 ABC transporter ATP-binding protein [Aliivibrio sp. S4TY1]MDD9162643.1 ABC transporter ATP-binding protein [Aliivibrio sp. S4MY2]MDD9166996.1 ABC transporter ATP-binding protein [Aliivibrio sp. S4MY4]MDD9183720.1 ABC transporter ATP-binding protein [Aliivibrio sp. S4MY3]